MRTFLRRFASAYAVLVGLVTVFAWGAVLASMHERREFPTGLELLQYMVTLPTSYVTVRQYQWAQGIFSWLFADVAMVTVAGVIQVTALYTLAALASKGRRGTKSSSAES